MENLNIKLHQYQKEILKKLTTEHFLKFNDLIIDGLESEHMNYHLKKLLEYNFVQKIQDGYTLTDLGKDYTNLLDDNVEIVEKQPKNSIVINGMRLNSQGEIEYLLNKRLRHPYYGKVGRLTGKVRFGETFEEAAKRELYEETGLTAKEFRLESVYRKIRRREDGEFVQDVVFYIFDVLDFSGELILKTPFQENFWKTEREVKAENLDVYDDMTYRNNLETGMLHIKEDVNIAEGF